MAILRFGVFEVDAESGELRKRGFRVRLREQPLRLLLALAASAGRVVTREELRHQLWPDGTFVDFDRAINKAVSELRWALGDSATAPRLIETLSKRGYRFIGSVETVPGASPPEEDRNLADAHLAYLTGRYLWNRRTIDDLHKSTTYFERALEHDPGCALALVGTADVHLLQGIWGLEPSDASFPSARRFAGQALECDPHLAEAHTSLAEVLTAYEWDWRRADMRYRHALSIRPYATAHQFYAQMLACLGRFSEAAYHIEQARRVDPISPAINSFFPFIYLAGRRYGRALEEAQRAVDLEPHAPMAHWILGRAYLFSNQPERAVNALEHAVRLIGRASMWISELSYARARAGDRSGAAALVAELVERGRHEHVSAYDLAVAFTGLQERAAALDQLERAFEHREMRIINLGDPEFETLRGEPAYRRLLARLHLPGGPDTA